LACVKRHATFVSSDIFRSDDDGEQPTGVGTDRLRGRRLREQPQKPHGKNARPLWVMRMAVRRWCVRLHLFYDVPRIGWLPGRGLFVGTRQRGGNCFFVSLKRKGRADAIARSRRGLDRFDGLILNCELLN
jgi:hypothetical protein